MTRILVLYYSTYGHVETLANAVAEGARGVPGAEVSVKRVAETVPTEVIGRPSVVIVVLTEGDQFAIRFTPKCGCKGKSRPEGRMTSIHGAPARLRA